MATVTFGKLAQDFRFKSDLVTHTGASQDDTNNFSRVSWIAPVQYGGSDIDLDGGFITHNGQPSGLLVGGVVTSMSLDLANNSPSAPELSVTGLALPINSYFPVLYNNGTAASQNDLFWQTTLGAADTIDFGTTATSKKIAITFAGDARNVTGNREITTAADTMKGDVGKGAVAGDVSSIEGGSTVHGGNDTMSIAGFAANFCGDALAVSGNLDGGDDILTSLTFAIAVGDAFEVGYGATVHGGDDQITTLRSGAGVGDVAYLSGALKGGDDTLIGSPFNDVLYGDAAFVGSIGDLKGGADTIHGGKGDDDIYGDQNVANEGALIKGGNDKLYGEAGRDQIHGNAGKDVISGGADRDTLYGGKGDDTFVFDAKFGSKNVDSIKDFSHADDTVRLDHDIFKGLRTGKLSDDAFHFGTKAADKEDRILYDKKHGDLYFDRDGTKSHYDPIKFAEVRDDTSVSHNDFFVV